MGADEAVAVDDPHGVGLLGVEKARVLTAAIRRIGRFDLVLCGCESADWVERVVGPLLAEALAAACVTFVSRIELRNGALLVRRMADEGFHQLEVRLPAVLSVTSAETNRPRPAKVKDIMTGRRKPVRGWPMADLAGTSPDGEAPG